MTFENLTLTMQIITNLENLRRDILNNMERYEKNIQSKKISTAENITLIEEDTAQYLRRLNWQERILNDINLKDKLNSGLSNIGLNLTEFYNNYNELKTIAEQINNKTFVDDADILNFFDNLKSSITKHERLF